VLGDTVNLASRLEGANKFYSTTIMASEATKALTGSTFAWREIDTIRVKGRVDAGRVFEPLGDADTIKPEHAAHAKAYADGLARFRARDFAGAAEAFATAAKDDLPSALFLARANSSPASHRARTGTPSIRWRRSRVNNLLTTEQAYVTCFRTIQISLGVDQKASRKSNLFSSHGC